MNKDLHKLYEHIPTRTFVEILGVQNREVIFGNFLAFLLDPKEMHGLDELFLKAFVLTPIKELLGNQDMVTNHFKHSHDLKSVKVHKEVRTSNNNRIDFVLEGVDFVVGIEFKINHNLSNDLMDYKNHIVDKFPLEDKDNYYFYVLTPNDKKIDDHSKIDPSFKRVIFQHFYQKLKELALERKMDLTKNFYSNEFIKTLENRSYHHSHYVVFETLSNRIGGKLNTEKRPKIKLGKGNDYLMYRPERGFYIKQENNQRIEFGKPNDFDDLVNIINLKLKEHL